MNTDGLLINCEQKSLLKMFSALADDKNAYKAQNNKEVSHKTIGILCAPLCIFDNIIVKEKLGDILVCFEAVFISKRPTSLKRFIQTHSRSNCIIY